MREPSGAYSVVVRGAVPLARRVSPAAARNSGTSSSAILPGAMPCRKTAATLGGGPAGEAVRLCSNAPAASAGSTRKARPRSPARVAMPSARGCRSPASHWCSTPRT
ncbi:hypothetical protein SHIRM173S_04339 [Streptomyces hirsutus]